MSRRTAALAAAAAGLAMPAGLLFPLTPADAGAGLAHGQVVARSLAARVSPYTAAERTGTLRAGARVDIYCKVHAEPVAGNDIWYLVPDEVHGAAFLSARYVRNVGTSPHWCTAISVPTRPTATVAVRQAPTTASARLGTVRKGAPVMVMCSFPGQSVRGDNRWFLTSSGHWISGRYLPARDARSCE